MKLPTNHKLLEIAGRLLLEQMNKMERNNPDHPYWKIVKMPEKENNK